MIYAEILKTLESVNQFVITITPHVLGGLRAVEPLSLEASDYLKLGTVRYEQMGEDIIMLARPVRDPLKE